MAQSEEERYAFSGKMGSVVLENLEHRPATRAWREHGQEIIDCFHAVRNESCAGLMLFGSVAIGDDWEDSDIDLAILTTPKSDFDSVLSVSELIIETCKVGVDLHFSFIPERASYIIERSGGVRLC